MGKEWMLLDEVMVIDLENMELMELVGLFFINRVKTLLNEDYLDVGSVRRIGID